MKDSFIGIFVSDTVIVTCESIIAITLLVVCIFLHKRIKQTKKNTEQEESIREWEQLQRSLKNEKGR